MEREHIRIDRDALTLDTRLVILPQPLLNFGLKEIHRLDPEARVFTENELMVKGEGLPNLQDVWTAFDAIYANTPCYLMGPVVIETRIDNAALIEWAKTNWDIATAGNPDYPQLVYSSEDWKNYSVESANASRIQLISEWTDLVENDDPEFPVDRSGIKPIPSMVYKESMKVVPYEEHYLFIDDAGRLV